MSAILNYAVDADYLDKNRLKHMAVPEGAKRHRVVTPEEPGRALFGLLPQLWRAILVGLNTGLREQRMWTLTKLGL